MPGEPVNRFLIAAIADRLIYDDGTQFDPADARALLDALPRRRSPRFELGISGKYKGPGTRGYASGVGDVNIDADKEKKFDYKTSQDAYTRAGQWKLSWSPTWRGQWVEIEQVMADATDEGRGARLRYDRSGKPVGMDIRTVARFRIAVVTFLFPGWAPWKKPAST